MARRRSTANGRRGMGCRAGSERPVSCGRGPPPNMGCEQDLPNRVVPSLRLSYHVTLSLSVRVEAEFRQGEHVGWERTPPGLAVVANAT